MKIKELPKTNLGFFPTPLVELKKLSKHLNGPRIFMKRDDQTGLAFGGNKTRKLEYLIADAIAKNYDTIITGGAEQSNHCRQTSAAAAAAGLKCHLVLGGSEPKLFQGNFLLDSLFGAVIHWTGEFRKGEKIPEIVEKLSSQGNKPYVIPYGGSNAIGASAFAYAVRELKLQLSQLNEKIDYIVFSSSSGGTHAGLLVGKIAFNFQSEIVGIGIDKGETGDEPLEIHIKNIANETADLLGLDHKFDLSEVIIKHEYEGSGYGVVGDLEIEAIKLTAANEGIILDPVYTGRTMGGLIDMIRKKEIPANKNVLFWHTGGTPSIFNYSSELTTSANAPLRGWKKLTNI